MTNSTDTGKSFADICKEMSLKPSSSYKTLIEKKLINDEFLEYLTGAEKFFNFKWTPETLDEFLRSWLYRVEQLLNQEKDKLNPEEETLDKMRGWADTYMMKLADPNATKLLDQFSGILSQLQADGSVITINGKEHKGYKFYDPKNPIILDNAHKTKEQIFEEKERTKMDYFTLDNDDPTNVYDFKLRDYTRRFCTVAGHNGIEHFQNKSETFRRRLELIDTAKSYRFGNSFLPLLIQHNKNEYGLRRMPRDNMWVEVGLKFDELFVCGIHIAKVYLDTTKSGFGTQLFRFYDEIIPNSYKEVGISVFVVGFSDETTTFYYHFILEHTDIEKDKLRGRYAYACPYCSMPMKTLETAHKFYCDKDSCIKAFQNGVKVVYNLDDPIVKEQMHLFEMKSVWKTEDKIRQFTTNLLDFLTNKRVQIITNFSEAELVDRNKKRAKRGKEPLFPVSIIKVDGTLKEYVSFISKRFNGNYKLARIETPVDGHFYRFKDKEVWTGLYGWIKGCETDDAIREKLAKKVRVDDKGIQLPDEEQYEWDNLYKLIKVWKLPFYRFKGEGDPRPRIDVIEVNE